MPQVPVFNRQVGEAPMPNVRLDDSAPTAAFQSPAPLDSSGMAQAYERMQAHDDQLAVLDADNQLSEHAIALSSAALARKGKDALGATSDTKDQYMKAASDISGSLTNERQRLAFEQRAQARWASLHEQVERHTAAEAESYDRETTGAALTNRLNDAVSNYQDPQKVQQALAEQRAILTDFGNRQGMSPEVVTEKVGAVLSRTHTQILDRMLAAGDDLAAQRYYAANKDAVVGTDRVQVERALEASSSLGEAQRQTDAIMATPGITRADAEAKVRAIQDPKVRKLAQSNVDQEFLRRERDDRERSESAYQAAALWAEQHGRRPVATVWATLDLSQREAIDTRLKQLAGGEKQQTDWIKYYDWRQMAASPTTRAQFLAIPAAELRRSLGDSEFREMTDLKAGIVKGDATTEQKLDGYQSNDQIVTDAYHSAFGRTLQGDKRLADFRRAVDVEAAQLEQGTKKPVTNDQLRQITDNLLTRRVVDQHWYGDEKVRPFEVQTASDVPSAERAKIEDAMRRRGLVPTEAQVVALYRKKLSTLPAAR